MNVTVCELPHEAGPLAEGWARLCEHTAKHDSDFVLLPEFAFIEPLWERERFDVRRWENGVATGDTWTARLAELRAAHVVSTRPAMAGRRCFNEGFMWTRGSGIAPLRRKYFLPDEAGGWETRWFARGDREFPSFAAGGISFALNICTELWALETYAAYAEMGIDAVICPRATSAGTFGNWLSAGIVAAVRSGAYCLSSNRVHPDGSCGGRGWIIDPDGEVLAMTSRDAPFHTVEIDTGAVRAAAQSYPRYVFAN